MPYFYKASERKARQLAPGATIRTFWGDKVLMSLVDCQPGADVPRHNHPHEQAGMVISGSLEMTVGEETRTLQPGDLYVIPGGVYHSVRVGSAPCQVLDIFSPVRDDYKY